MHLDNNHISCQYCGIVADFKQCSDLYGTKRDFWGVFTKCPNCLKCLHRERVNKFPTLFEEAECGIEHERNLG